MNTGSSTVKVVVIYPRPTDETEFERAYEEDHLPMVEEKLKGMTRLVTTKVLDSPQGKVAAYRLAEVHFSSMDDLNKCLQSDGGKEVVDHAVKISTGGPPILLICEERATVFW
ncbi:MAG: EthD family reductase [Acidobacteriota bacterium]|jgi:uncharacterized protein (TIGR02118 family)|nr:EthD family reductase [Acidobacteriota bacterium]